jgi:hypothetical protein
MRYRSVGLLLAMAGWILLLLSPVLTLLMVYLYLPSPMTFCGAEGGSFCLTGNWLPNLLMRYGMSVTSIGLAYVVLLAVTLLMGGAGVLLLHRDRVVVGAILLVSASAICLILSIGFYLSPALMLTGGIVALATERDNAR